MMKLVLDPVFSLNYNPSTLSVSLTMFFLFFASLNLLLYLYYSSPKSNYLLLPTHAVLGFLATSTTRGVMWLLPLRSFRYCSKTHRDILECFWNML